MPIKSNRLVLTIGGFDGIHLGHQEIISHVQEIAHKIDGISALITFDPHPAQFLYPDFPYLLTPLEEKLLLLTELGIEQIHVIQFDKRLCLLEPEEFVGTHLDVLSPAAVIIGADHRFGRGAKGDVGLLKRILEPKGIKVIVVPEFLHLGASVKSTRIREHLLLGHVRLAAELLGRTYALTGNIVRGTGTGSRLGFPTINIKPVTKEKLLPLEGVYAATAEIESEQFFGVLNIGFRPTFSGEERTIEIHLLNFSSEIESGKKITVHFLERIRAELRFASADALAEQIRQDIAAAKKILKI